MSLVSWGDRHLCITECRAEQLFLTSSPVAAVFVPVKQSQEEKDRERENREITNYFKVVCRKMQRALVGEWLVISYAQTIWTRAALSYWLLKLG